jgi:hypothetical protein
MNSNFTIIEDLFSDEGNNGMMEGNPNSFARNPSMMTAKSFSNHMPEDMRPRRPQYAQEQMPMSIPPLPISQPSLPPSFAEHVSCKDVFIHTENCPVCSSYFKKDIKFYWLIIFILVLVILFLMRSKRD